MSRNEAGGFRSRLCRKDCRPVYKITNCPEHTRGYLKRSQHSKHCAKRPKPPKLASLRDSAGAGSAAGERQSGVPMLGKVQSVVASPPCAAAASARARRRRSREGSSPSTALSVPAPGCADCSTLARCDFQNVGRTLCSGSE